MNSKLGALGLAILAALAMGAIGVVNATAETGGHFVSEVEHTIVNQTAGGDTNHGFQVEINGTEGVIVCDHASAAGTAESSTITEVAGVTVLDECHTEGSETFWTVHMNGCEGRGTVAPGDPATTEHTNTMVCPEGNAIEVTHPNCSITVPPQANVGGFTYTQITENEKYAITVDVNLEYAVEFHEGICIFLGTNQTATVSGSTIVRGQDTVGNQVSITAT